MDHAVTAHPPLPIEAATRLLGMLATDDGFRDLFVIAPKEALLQIGLDDWQADAALAGRSCLAVRTLASKEMIAASHDRLLASLTSRGAHTVVFTFAKGGPAVAVSSAVLPTPVAA